jgi:DinB superfamily
MANQAASLPEDLREIQAQLTASDHEAQALLRDLDEEQLNWRPDEKSWSIAQCLDHLNVTNRVYLAPMLHAIEQARRKGSVRKGPIHLGFFGRWFAANMEPPPKRKLPAPRKIVPAVRKGKAELIEEWRRAQAELDAVLREGAGIDLNETRFVNPFISLIRFSVGTGLQVIAAHERRHLWQAGQVRGRAGFPQSSRKS